MHVCTSACMCCSLVKARNFCATAVCSLKSILAHTYTHNTRAVAYTYLTPWPCKVREFLSAVLSGVLAAACAPKRMPAPLSSLTCCCCCMYVCMYVCMYAGSTIVADLLLLLLLLYVCLYVCMHVCWNHCRCPAAAAVCMYMCMHVCMYAGATIVAALLLLYVCMYVCMPAPLSSLTCCCCCMYVCMYICMYVYMYVCLHCCCCCPAFVCLCVCMHTCTSIVVSAMLLHECMYTCMIALRDTCVHIPLYAYVCIYATCVCVSVHSIPAALDSLARCLRHHQTPRPHLDAGFFSPAIFLTCAHTRTGVRHQAATRHPLRPRLPR